MSSKRILILYLIWLVIIRKSRCATWSEPDLLQNFFPGSYQFINFEYKKWTCNNRFLLKMMAKKALTIRPSDDPRRHLWNFSWPEKTKKIQLMARKLKMSEVFSPDGIRVPVTVLELLPEIICQFLAFGNADVCYGDLITEHAWLKRPHIGKILKICGNHRKLESCSIQPPDNFLLGQILDASSLLNSTELTITGIGKGKGFGGTIARHGFHRGPASHGSRHHRKPGSIGAGTDPGRVFPGKKMPGRYGNKRVTVRGLKLIALNPIKNWLMVKGSVPGNPKSILKITC